MASNQLIKRVKIEQFLLPLFAFTVLTTLACMLTILWVAAPGISAAQYAAPIGKIILVFLFTSLGTCYFEYFFHRYVLHQPLLPLVKKLYRQHTLHHGLTRIVRKSRPNGPDILVVVENKFPIVEEEQGEASFFPWFTLGVFGILLSPFLILAHFLIPSYPWFLGGFLALASSLILYEMFHAINHWPIEKWLPMLENPRWKWFWHPAYSFHLRHHAVIDCNESISGFFGVPLADWTFGTSVVPQSIYADGDEWQESEFTRPQPRWLIHQLDIWVKGVVQRRRSTARADKAEKTQEEIDLAVSRMSDGNSKI